MTDVPQPPVPPPGGLPEFGQSTAGGWGSSTPITPQPAPGWPTAPGSAVPPPGAPPAWGTQPGGWTPPPVVKKSGLAIASLVLGIVGLVTCYVLIPSLLAVIFGFIALKAIRGSDGTITGRSMAIWGTVLGIIGVIAFAGFLALGLSGALDEDTTTADGELVAPSDLEVGDCVVKPAEEDNVVRVEVIDCDIAHYGEVFAVGDANPDGDREYPGTNAIGEEISDSCSAEFESFVGVRSPESEYGIVYLFPVEASWDNDSTYQCVAVADDEVPFIGSVEDSGR